MMNTTSGGFIEHHMVSRVLLRRFCGPTNEMTALRLPYRSVRPKGPGGVAFFRGPDTQEAREFEAHWQSIETDLPLAFAAVDDGTIFQHEDLVALLHECLAMHMARSQTILQIHHQLLPGILEERQREMARDPQLLELFRSEHAGLYPVGEDAITMAAESAIERIRTSLEAGAFILERMKENYPKAQEFVSRYSIEIDTPENGEFLIGDSPAASIRKGHPGVGPLQGVKWDEADTIILPIGRQHGIALAQKNRFLELPDEWVEFVNRVQVVGAIEYIMWHPDHDAHTFVHQILNGPAGQ